MDPETIHNPRKRARDGRVRLANDEHVAFVETAADFDDAGRARLTFAQPPGPELLTRTKHNIRYGILHAVSCARVENLHRSHHPRTIYYDTPRLIASDNRTVALHGKYRLKLDEDTCEEFVKEHPDVAFIVIEQYSCEHYLAKMTQSFVQLEVPLNDRARRNQLLPLFSILREDGPFAVPHSQGISLLSPSLRLTISNVKRRLPHSLRGVVLRGADEGVFALGGDMANNSPVKNDISIEFPELNITSMDDFYHLRSSWPNLWQDQFSDIASNHWATLDALFTYICEISKVDFDAADDLFAQGKVSDAHFSKLFCPLELVVQPTAGSVQAYQLQQILFMDSIALELRYSAWEYDGTFVRKFDQQRLAWPPKKRAIDITSLKVYPFKYARHDLQSLLKSRGEMFWSCRKKKFVSYVSPDPMFTTNPRYMIDMKMYNKMHPPKSSLENSGSSSRESGRLDISDQQEPPDENFKYLLPQKIRGYGFHDKKWRQKFRQLSQSVYLLTTVIGLLDVVNIREVDWNSEAFDCHLVLKSKKKELLKALITVHMLGNKSYQSDIIENKGRGLIILLHGSPGTGKTLTAESIAEFTLKPLYRVTCGDIGTDPETVERYLESVLQIGTIWECVVLLDEADVFLEERSPTDLQRNAVVSSFLRVLEYFNGILILTSNRVGTFDEAFKSRVQLALHYPALDQDGRWEVWNNFLTVMQKEGQDMNYNEIRGKLDLLAKSELNGRQIRNTVNTGRQLARYRSEKLAYIHIEQAIEVLKEFEDYVTEAQGHEDADYAREMGHRAG